MSFEQRKAMTDRDRGRMGGVTFPDDVDVVFLPNSGNPTDDFTEVNLHHTEGFDSHQAVSDGLYMIRGKDYANFMTKVHQEESNEGFRKKITPEYPDGTIIDASAAAGSGVKDEGLIDNDPATLKRFGYLTTPRREEKDD